MDLYSQQFFASVRPPLTVRFTIRALSVSSDGMTATAEVFQEESRVREIEGQRHTFDKKVVQRDTWTKTNQGWKLKVVDNRNPRR